MEAEELAMAIRPDDHSATDGVPGADPVPEDGVPQPPARPGPGLRPAMVVMGIAVVIVGIFSAAAAVTNGGSGGAGSSGRSSPSTVRGTTLLAVPGSHLVKSIVQPGSPPSNIVQAVWVPQGSVFVASGTGSAGTGQYDEQVVLSVGASQASVIAFFRAELPARHWGVFSTGPATNEPGTVEVLGKQAGDDGWYWEIGALVSPTTFTPTSTATGKSGLSAGGAGNTRFTIRLYQVPDQA